MPLNLPPMNDDNGAKTYLPLVRIIARAMYRKYQYALPDLCEEDLLSWGTFGLINGLKDYDPKKTPHKKKYISYRIMWAIYNGINKWQKSISDHETHFDDVYEGFEPGVDPDQDSSLIMKALIEEIEKLPARLKRIVIMRFWKGCSFGEISDAEGITKQRCEQLLKKAILHLQSQFRQLELERVARQCGRKA